MLRAYRISSGALEQVEGDLDAAALRKAQWIELCKATPQEAKLVESALGVDTKPANEYEPFQVSSQFSATDRQLTMTGLILAVDDKNDPRLLKIIFIRSKDTLITVTEDSEAGMSRMIEECENCFSHRSGRDDVFAAILDMIVDHTDNILDQVGYNLECINDMVFQHHETKQSRRLLRHSPRKRNRQLEHILTELGPNREILVKLRRSVLSFRRLAAFLRDHKPAKAMAARIEIFEHDLRSIEEAEADLSATAGFLLDGVIGYIGLLQNNVMNILTLVTLLLTPAMVVGAIYGMNFKYMPELQWTYGYPLALGLIVVSTAGLWVWVRARGL